MILILGSGVTGKSVANYCEKHGLDYTFDETSDYRVVVKSPGIKYNNRIVVEALKKGIEVISDIELAYRLHKAYYIGITGTNGKTTVVSLIKHIFEVNNIDCEAVGNIGNPIFDHLDKKILIVELSSFQLLGIKEFKPNIALITNISRAHMDYHDSYEEYINAKHRIHMNMEKDNVFVNSNMNSDLKSYNDKVIEFESNLIGEHNKENMLAAYTVAKCYGLESEKIKAAIKTFKGLEHRIEEFIPNVFNDSKATNPVSMLKAIETLDDELTLICGGQNRYEDFSVLIPVINKIKQVICYGETKNILVDFFSKHSVNVLGVNTLTQAVQIAKLIKEHNQILFSPGCSSFDQFKSYRERGKKFKKLFVQNMY
ncbi:Mur ligase family protein [Mycoplasmatota bacterium zrk1]